MKNEELQRLRAVAILIVILHHVKWFREHLPQLMVMGLNGVDIFFVISGYLVTKSLVSDLPGDLEKDSDWLSRFRRSAGAWGAFLRRRFWRLFPAAMFWLVVPLALALLFNESGRFGSGEWNECLRVLLTNLTLTYNYAFAAGAASYHHSYYWSLNVEEHYYLLLPVLCIMAPTVRWRVISLVGCIIGSVVLRYTAVSSPFPYFLSHYRFDQLAMGSLIAFYFMRYPLAKRAEGEAAVVHPRKRALGIVSLAIVLLLWFFPGMYGDSKVLIFFLPMLVYGLLSSVLLVMALHDRGFVLDVPGLRWLLRWVGDRSYTLYLAHFPVLWLQEEIYHRLEVEPPLLVSVVVYLALLALAVDLFYRKIEMPLNRFGRHPLGRRSTA